MFERRNSRVDVHGADAPPRPCWDDGAKTLRLGELTVKSFLQPARSQQRILTAFQEEGWPAWILDPLVPAAGANVEQIKQRLRSAVNNLNRAQNGSIRIHFHLDGTGQGIGWHVQRVKSE